MILLLEDNKYLEITLESIKKTCSSALTIVVTDSVDGFIDENTHLTEPVFFIRGESIKIINTTFEKQLHDAMQQNAEYFSVSKQYPGVYLSKLFYKAYDIAEIPDYKTKFDTDVMLINPRKYAEHRNSDIWKMKQNSKVSLLSYGLNAKDDCLMTQIMSPYQLLKRNVWFHRNAGIVNFSKDVINANNIESYILMPFDLLNTYTSKVKVDVSDIIGYKATQSNLLFGKIKESMINVS